MGQWQFVNVKEEFAPLLIFKHVAGVNNYTVNWCTKLSQNDNRKIKWHNWVGREFITLSNLY